jgi:dCMP deaminase
MSEKVNWDVRLLELARYISGWSKDESTKIGTVIADDSHVVRATGYNGLCRGLNDNVKARNERPLKYRWYEHGERNAIYNAARIGIPMEGCTIYLMSLCCTDCARAIIQAGIKRIVTTPPEYDNPRWGPDLLIAKEMLDEAGIQIKIVDTSPGTVIGNKV